MIHACPAGFGIVLGACFVCLQKGFDPAVVASFALGFGLLLTGIGWELHKLAKRP